jgi:hypothetical protein
MAGQGWPARAVILDAQPRRFPRGRAEDRVMSEQEAEAAAARTHNSVLREAKELASRIGPPFSGDQRGERVLAYLMAATTDAQHRLGAAMIVRFLMRRLRGTTLSADVRYEDFDLLASLVFRAPRPGVGKKPPRLSQAILDAETYLPRSSLESAIGALAEAEQISRGAARQRIVKAERISGLELARAPKAFRRRAV